MYKKEHEILFKYLNAIGVIIVVLDKSGNIIFVNNKFLDLTGFTYEEIIGSNWFNTFLPESIRDTVKNIFTGAMRGEVDYINSTINPLHTKNGKGLSVKWNNVVLKDDNQEITGIISSGENIEEILELENEILSQRNLYSTMLSASPDFIVLKDKNFRYIGANETAKKFFRKISNDNSYDVIGKTDFDIFPELTAKEFRAEDEEIIKTGNKRIFEYKIGIGTNKFEEIMLSVVNEKKSGWAQRYKTPVFNDDNSIMGILIIVRNITELKKIQEELEKAKNGLEIEVVKRTRELTETNDNLYKEIHRREKVETELIKAKEYAEQMNKYKDEFLAYISHEIRNPISLISLNTYTLVNDKSFNEINKAKLIEIDSSVNAVLNVVEDVLDIAQIEAGKMRIMENTFSLKELLDETVSIIKVQADRKDLKINTKCDIDNLYSDKTRIRQVLINLLSNAIKNTDEGEIKINISQKGDQVLFSVFDTGRGIEHKNIAKIFEPFFREEMQNISNKGMGLGLSICKKIVTNLGGEIFVNSQQGKGSEFSFTIPFVKNIINEKTNYFI